jgi:hypothetical protein
MNGMLDLSSGETEALFSIGGLGNGIGDDEINFCWCLVNLRIKNRFFAFDMTNDELLSFGDVVYLRNSLENLLLDQFREKQTIGFIEPDLEIILYPKYDLRKAKDVLYVREGMEIQDVYAELIVNLADKASGYNGQFYSFPLDCKHKNQRLPAVPRRLLFHGRYRDDNRRRRRRRAARLWRQRGQFHRFDEEMGAALPECRVRREVWRMAFF